MNKHGATWDSVFRKECLMTSDFLWSSTGPLSTEAGCSHRSQAVIFFTFHLWARVGSRLVLSGYNPNTERTS